MGNETSQRLAARLDAAFKDRGVGTAEVARYMHVSPPTVSGWRKRGQIDKERLPLLSAWLNVPLEWWLSGNPEQVPPRDRPPLAVDFGGSYRVIPKVQFTASAGLSGFAIEYINDDPSPISFRADWFQRKNLNPQRCFAIRVSGSSMESGLYDGDSVVVNTDATTPKDGEVFVLNHEGEIVIKRLIRDEGRWWMTSDNPDKVRFPRRAVTELTHIIGQAVHKHSDRL